MTVSATSQAGEMNLIVWTENPGGFSRRFAERFADHVLGVPTPSLRQDRADRLSRGWFQDSVLPLTLGGGLVVREVVKQVLETMRERIRQEHKSGRERIRHGLSEVPPSHRKRK